MRHTALRLFLLATLVTTSLFAKTRPSKQYTIEQFMNTVAVGGASFSPDEKEILSTSTATTPRRTTAS